MRVLQIKGFVQKTHKIKVQHQIGELLKDMDPPKGMLKIDLENFQKNHDIVDKVKKKKVKICLLVQIKYLTKDPNAGPKNLQKPLMFGVSTFDFRRLRPHDYAGD